MIDEYIEAMSEWISEKQRQQSRRLAEERYEALRNTIANLYGRAFLNELESNVDGIISGSRYNDTITDRLGLLRRQYRTKCKIDIPYRIMGKAYYHSVYEPFNKIHKHFDEKHALNQMRKRSKVRQRFNRLLKVILLEYGEAVQHELLWKAKTLALAEVIKESKYQKFSWAKGYAENDLSFALRHLRILYAYTIWQRESIDGTHIHTQINNNYKDCMLDHYKK